MKKEAAASLKDGLNMPILHRVATAGGKHDQNVERSLLTRAFADLGIKLKPILLKVPRYVKRKGKVIDSLAAVIGPQDVMRSLAGHEKFRSIFGHRGQWAKFWHLMREEVWFTQHPLVDQIRSAPEDHCPMLLHQDDAPVSRRVGRNFRAVNMFSPCADHQETQLMSIFPLAVTPNDDTMDAAVKERQDETIAWGFKQSAQNKYELEAPPFVIMCRHRRELQGQEIMSTGERLTYAGFTGDLMMFALDFELPHHYNREQISMVTKAAKSGPNNFADPRKEAAWASTARDVTEWLTHLEDNDLELPKLAEIPGFHTHNMYEDQLHMDALGLRQHSCGSVLRDLCYESEFGASMHGPGTWQDKLNACLHGATREFTEWQSVNGVHCTQSAFKTLGLSLHRQDDFPILKAKGKNCISVSQWLLQKCESVYRADPTNWVKQQRFTLLWGLCGLWEVPHRIRPRFELTDAEADELEKHRLCALLAYYNLHRESAMSPRPGYNITPKFNSVDVMCRRASRTKVSQHLFWTFRTEHHMGFLAKTMFKTHGASSKRRVVERWLVAFWTWLMEDKVE